MGFPRFLESSFTYQLKRSAANDLRKRCVKMGSLKYFALGVLLFAIVIRARIIPDADDEPNVVEEKSVATEEVDNEADQVDTVLDALRRAIETELPEEEEDMQRRQPDPSPRWRRRRSCNSRACRRG